MSWVEVTVADTLSTQLATNNYEKTTSTIAPPATVTSTQLIDGPTYHYRLPHNKTLIKLLADQLPDQLPVLLQNFSTSTLLTSYPNNSYQHQYIGQNNSYPNNQQIPTQNFSTD
jgi:hypothetical protein